MKTINTLLLLMGVMLSGACTVSTELQEGVAIELDTPVGALKAQKTAGVIEASGDTDRTLEITPIGADGVPLAQPITIPKGDFDIIVPVGTVRIQVKEVSGFRALEQKFWLYSLPPLEKDLMPGGEDQFSHVFSQVTYTGPTDGWQETLAAFNSMGSSQAATAGVSVDMFVEVITDRSYQNGGALSKLPGMVIVADDDQITNFTATLMGSTTLTEMSSTASGDSGAWGSWANAYTFFKPSAAWYGSGDIYVSYTLADGTSRGVTFTMGL